MMRTEVVKLYIRVYYDVFRSKISFLPIMPVLSVLVMIGTVYDKKFFGPNWYLILIFLLLVTALATGSTVFSIRNRLRLPSALLNRYLKQLKYGKKAFAKGWQSEAVEIDSSQPIRGLKFAHLSSDHVDSSTPFEPTIIGSERYGLESRRVHSYDRYSRHSSPCRGFWECVCGFYSLKSYGELLATTNRMYHRDGYTDPHISTRVLLECEYWGDIYPGANGYRAEYQRVLRVLFLGYCGLCACDDLLRSEATHLAILTKPLMPRNELTRISVRYVSYREQKDCVQPIDHRYVFPVCAKCASTRKYASVYTLGEMQDILQVDVAWYRF